ncbi:hypothetical protein [Halomicrobium salinisoli]|uniref:hypothetical protein n=1 Tax=Halomicrobium salinisoli TaxID=2878391 RepID=UPI001CF03665|nr:hypothetical protein [Halomicrobium salinisoli]
MPQSRIARLTELRRALPIAAALLVVGALLVPMWRITFLAPQYPSTELVVELYAYPRLGGDYAEVQALNKYVGFYYPDPVLVDPNYEVHEGAIRTPEWALGPVAFLGMAAVSLVVALAPTERKLRRGLAVQLVGTLTALVVMFAVIQYRLYQAGHALDPEAPLRGVEGFTPPVLGGYAVANISGFAWFGPGGYMVALAVALLVAAYLCRGTDATVGDVPALVRGWRDRKGDDGHLPGGD